MGANIDKVQLSNGTMAWSMISQEYMWNAITNLEQELEKDERSPLRTYGKKSKGRPFPLHYMPEVNIFPELGKKLHTHFLRLIAILRWSIELGRVDIITEASTLSQHQCSPRVGHLEPDYITFWYFKCALRKGQETCIIFDPSTPDVDENMFGQTQPKIWEDVYPGEEEQIPTNLPKTRGTRLKMGCYIDADHAGNLMTWRSHSGLLLYIQNCLVIWFRKRQKTVKFSSFGSEFVAL